MTKQTSPEPSAAPAFPETFKVSTDAFETFAAALNDGSVRAQAMMQSSLKAWEAEMGRYFEELTEHNRQTADALAKCQAPTEVLAVEQQWLASRAKAHLDSSLRVAKAFADAASSLETRPAGDHQTPTA